MVGSLAQLAHRLAACEAVLDVVGTGGGGVGRVFRSVIAAQLAAVSRTLHIGERPAVIAHDGHLRRPLQRRQGLGTTHSIAQRLSRRLSLARCAVRVLPEELMRTATDTR